MICICSFLFDAYCSQLFTFCCCSVTQSCLTLCNPVDCSMPGLPVHHQLPEFTQTHVHWVSDAIQPSHPLSSPLLPPSIFPSIRVLSNESVLHIRRPKYWTFSIPMVFHPFSSITQSCLTLCDLMDCSMPGLPVHHQLQEFTQIHVHRVGDAIQPSHPLSSPLLPPSIFPNIRVLSNESVLHIRWPKFWSFSFSISPSSEYSGLISFRMDWLNLLAFQGTLKSLLQHHTSKAAILWGSAFFIVQLWV